MARGLSRILVTGVGGFVGRYLVPALLQQFPQAQFLLTRFGDGPASPDEIRLDVRDAQATDRAVAEFAPDGVVHLAAISQVHEAQRAARAAFDVNVGGAINIAEAIRRHVPRAQFVFVSSGEVYGASFLTAAKPLDEHAPIDPVNVYAASKAAAEQFIAAMTREGLQAVRLRPFNHIGPGQSDKFVVASFVAQIVKIEQGVQEPVLRVGNLDARRDFLDVRDVVAAYIKVLTAEHLGNGAVLNIASGQTRRIGDVLESLLKLAKVPIAVAVDPSLIRAVDIPNAAGDAGLARRLLDWAPTVSFEQTLADMLELGRAAIFRARGFGSPGLSAACREPSAGRL